MNENQDIFEIVNSVAKGVGDAGRTVHTNSHNHALVENPFAWEDDQAEAED
ncbi:MAG: hypothetical protein MPN21_00960 [Thermoanaerobaculia bacterium]|nr:hypothetical protein [Thermoanaerobaculia bacterium]